MRLRFPVLFDILVVDDPDDIRWLNQHPDLQRPPDETAGPLQWLLNKMTVHALEFEGARLPVFLSREDAVRARKQRELTDALDEPERAPASDATWLGAYVAGYSVDAEGQVVQTDPPDQEPLVGVYVQQWCGRLFDRRYRSSIATYEAGRVVARWPTELPWRKLKATTRQQFEHAKRDVAQAAGRNIHAIHATTIGMENITRSVRRMRALAKRSGVNARTPEEAMRQCLVVPPLLLRGCEREVRAPFLKKPLSRRSVVIFLLARAYDKSGDLELAFLGDTWSACPAQHVVPHMLRGVWQAARELEAKQSSAWNTIRKATHVATRVLRAVGESV